MKNHLFVTFDTNLDITYSVIQGNTYKDNFNEEIDSMNIVLDGITADKRIKFEEPYHFCRISNSITSGENGIRWKNSDGNFVTYKYMLVDSLVETETNMQEHIYRYEIQLMNCIKLLEKVQCSNRMITHSLVTGSKTIYEYIDEYMTLYCPKIKSSTDGVTWSYDYLIKWKHLEQDERFQSVCADMQLNEPTLRELLTQLMLQVDCIPTCNYRMLGVIDFREAPTRFIATSRTSKVESMASDSYDTSLTISPTQILDSTNEVITEQIGFRDRNNAILSQLSNLQLETRFPIYNIKKFTLSYAGTQMLPTPVNQQCYTSLQDYPAGNYPTYGITDPGTYNMHPHLVSSGTKIRLGFCYNGGNVRKGKLRNIKIHFCKYEDAKFIETIILDSGNDEWELNWDNAFSGNVGEGPQGNDRGYQELLPGGTLGPYHQAALGYGQHGYWYFLDLDLPNDFNINVNRYAWFENEFVDHSQNDEVVWQFLPIRESDLTRADKAFITKLQVDCTNVFVGKQVGNISYPGLSSNTFFGNMTHTPTTMISGVNYAADITNLLVESRKRQLLLTNYNDMIYIRDHPTQYSADDFAKYIYATMGYNIGGREITGFSSSFSKAQMWWDKTYSYFDNIISYINNYNLLQLEPVNYDDSYIQKLSAALGNMPLNVITLTVEGNTGIPTVGNQKGRFFFNIVYQPLNNLKLKIPKEDKNIPLDLTTLNSSENGLADFDRFTKYVQSMTDRIGNKTIQISQVTDNFDEVMPLNSIYDDRYIVFKREIAIYENYLTVLYTMSEKYVLQNYFTSIITKYRAYENTDYESAITRKENLIIYCLLSAETYYDGDDHILWTEPEYEGLLLSGLGYKYFNDENNEWVNFGSDLNLRYLVRKSENFNGDEESTKEEISLPTYKNGFAIVFEEFDNVSAGLYLKSANLPYFDVTHSALGGIEQIWQRWNMDVYKQSQELTFVSRIAVMAFSEDGISAMIKHPILLKDIVNYEDFSLFKVVDNKETTQYTYNKDVSEIINQTIQFYFYNDNDEIEFNQAMFRSSILVNQSQERPNLIYITDKNDKVMDDKIIGQGDVVFVESASELQYIHIGFDYEVNKFYIYVDWESINEKYEETETDIEFDKIIISRWTEIFPTLKIRCCDYISFKRRMIKTKYYLTLNDTKTNEVWRFFGRDDLFNVLSVTNGDDRNVRYLSPIVSFNINQTDFNNGVEDSYSFTITNNNRSTVTLHIITTIPSSTDLTFDIPAQSTITLLSNTDLNGILDENVEFRGSDIKGYFSGTSANSQQVVILSAVTYVESPSIYKNIDLQHDSITLEITNNNPCSVYLHTAGSSNTQTFISEEIKAGETYIISNDTNSSNYNANFANSIRNSWDAYKIGMLGDDYYCWFETKYNNYHSTNVIILEISVPISPVIDNFIQDGNNFSFEVENNNFYDCPLFVSYNGIHTYIDDIDANNSIFIDEQTNQTLTQYYLNYIQGTLQYDVYLFFPGGDLVLLWGSN